MKLNLLLSMNIDSEYINLWIFKIKTSNIEALINKSINIITTIIITILLMYITIKVGNKIIDKFVNRQIKSNARFTMDNQKAKTIGGVLKSGLKYMTYFIGIAIIIGSVFSGMSLAVAGVGGVALGFGTQSLVKDVINGFFILFEDHYGIGDYLTIGESTGVVINFGIRTTVIKDFTGEVHFIPNGTINQVTNHSRSDSRIVVEFNIAYEEDIQNAINCIKKICDKYTKENKDITEPIMVYGVSSLTEGGISIKVVGKAKPLKHWALESGLRKEIKIGLDKEKIKIPYSQVKIISKK